MGTIDNRQEPRTPIELRVEYTRLNMFFADYTKNLSKGGTFIKTSTPAPIGTRFKFQLVIPSFDSPVELTGEVTWVLDPPAALAASTEPGMGVRFLFANPEQQLGFEEAVESLMSKNLGADIVKQLLDKRPSRA